MRRIVLTRCISKALCDNMYLDHHEFVLHLMNHGWNRADAEQCWSSADKVAS